MGGFWLDISGSTYWNLELVLGLQYGALVFLDIFFMNDNVSIYGSKQVAQNRVIIATDDNIF